MTANKILPENADLKQLKTQAKEFHKELLANDSNALARISKSHPKYIGDSEISLAKVGWRVADTQYVLAREYGFKSWEKLKHEIEKRMDD